MIDTSSLRKAPQRLLSAPQDDWQPPFPAPVLLPRVRRRCVALQSERAQAERLREAALRMQAPLDGAHTAAAQLRRILRFPNSGLRLSLEDRFTIVGMTGCGKSTLARQLVKVYSDYFPRATTYILDTSGDRKFDGERGLVEGMDAPLGGPGERLIWRPDMDDIERYDAWLGDIFHQDQPAVIWIDELSSLGGKSALSFPLNFQKLLKQGRKRHKVVVSLTQEAAYIPRQVLGMAWHVVRMRLTNSGDAAKLDELLHGSAKPAKDPLTPWGLWYRRLDKPDVARHFRDWTALLS